MKGVADSSPLHYLVQIKAENVLWQLYVELLTPPEVIAELTHARAPDAVRSWAADPPSWLRVVPVRGGGDDLGLGPGETAAIALALETHADALLIDERASTSVAKRRGIRTTGTFGDSCDGCRTEIDIAARCIRCFASHVVSWARRTDERSAGTRPRTRRSARLTSVLAAMAAEAATAAIEYVENRGKFRGVAERLLATAGNAAKTPRITGDIFSGPARPPRVPCRCKPGDREAGL